MRGGVQLTIAILCCTWFVTRVDCVGRCDRTPEGHVARKSPAGDKFKLKISGSPNTYVPGEVYTVSLQGTREKLVPHKFTGFFLTVEPLDSASFLRDPDVGKFQLFGDALTKFSETCRNTVTQTSSTPKSEIQVMWTAPPVGSGCVAFRTTVVEHRDVWYMDDGPLSRTLCEEVQENLDEQPQVLDRCCACDEAKYEVTFEGLWSRHTHPKDFPTNGWLTRFSDVIGASHTFNYSFWTYNGMASEGLKQVAEKGSTRMLESELKAESEHIRTIIKARGISYPNLTGKTFAVFRVDRKHHLMSLVSMMDPSPDWIVGVSNLELCLRNCSWVEFVVLNLYPWDVGTDSGVTYISPDEPTIPQDSIRRITASFPNNPSSPFYDPSGSDMKPLARLYLTRQRLYEKSCADNSISPDEDEHEQDCAVTPWSSWSECSVTCGRGNRLRQRNYVDPTRAEIGLCGRNLTDRAPCISKHPHCRKHHRHQGQHDNDLDATRDPICEVTDWSEWSSCSVTCGTGVRTRSREYRHAAGRKRCVHMTGAPILEQNEDCNMEDCEGEEGTEEEEDQDPCPSRPWAIWSPCSVTCGHGHKYRTRIQPASRDDESDPGCAHVIMHEAVQCAGDYATCDVSMAVAKDPDNSQDSTQSGLFGGLQAGSQIMDRNGHWRTDSDRITSDDGVIIDCEVSKWNEWSPCSATCGRGFKKRERVIKVHPQNGGQPCPKKLLKRKRCKVQSCDKFTSAGDQDLADSQQNDRDSQEPTWGEANYVSPPQCVMSPWGKWSPCSATCGVTAMRQRIRFVLHGGGDDSASCGPRVETKQCNLLPCRT